MKYLLLNALIWGLGAGYPAPLSAQEPAAQTEILWDTWGVPHIFARTNSELFYAFGWAQMANHGNLLLELYGQARGRGAEYWGASYIQGDQYVRIMEVPRRAQDWYRTQSPQMRAYLDAFAAGINAYAQAHPDRLDPQRQVVLPVQTEDVLAHLQRVVHLSFIGGNQARGAGQWQQAGSNAWAVAPSRSASGHALLLANPHLPWGGMMTWFEAHLQGPGLNAYGATLVGFPILAIAFNDHLGWTHTNNTMDGADLYELELAEGGYRWDDGVRAFEQRLDTLRVRQEDGTINEQPLPIMRSVHGPVLAQKEGKAVALRLVGLDQPHIMEQYWAMMGATSLDQFETALKRLQMPFFNVVYADRQGHILYLFGGHTPRRPQGDWTYWQGLVPGHTAATLWTDIHPYDELPRLLDPANGWVQNANDPPWTATMPYVLEATAFPPYMAPSSYLGFRQQRSVRMLSQDASITFEELIDYKHDTRMERADHLVDDLLAAVAAHGGDSLQTAAAVLTAWDRRAHATSKGAVLFEQWLSEVGRSPFAAPWQAERPLATPAGLDDPAAAVAALGHAAAKVRADHGALDIAWGQIHRLRVAGHDLPASGGGGNLGLFRTLWFNPGPDGKRQVTGGDSYVAAVEFGDTVRARTLLGYGNASQPDSPHRGDQLELMAQGQLRPVWRSRDAVEAHLEQRETIDWSGGE
ncbi:MAG: acylase [Candidatus Latescibacteria bacterium]|nr:acylase [Candidatus Latescibacterota bacterium]